MMHRRDFLRPPGSRAPQSRPGDVSIACSRGRRGVRRPGLSLRRRRSSTREKGFGVRLPGLLATSRGSVVAVCPEAVGQHDPTSATTPTSLVQRSADGRADLGEAANPLPGTRHLSASSGPLFEGPDQRGPIFSAFWKLPVTAPSRLEVLPHLRQDRRAFLAGQEHRPGAHLVRARTAQRPGPARTDGMDGPNNSVHGHPVEPGTPEGKTGDPRWFLYKEGEEGQIPGVRGGVLYSDDHGSTVAGGRSPAGGLGRGHRGGDVGRRSLRQLPQEPALSQRLAVARLESGRR